MKAHETPYKLYHRNYKSIEELYDDLADVILNITLKSDKVVIRHDADILEIGRCLGGFRTSVNGKREKGVWEDQDIYFCALEFVHGPQKKL